MGKLIDADAFDERIRLAVGSCEEELTEDFKDGISTVLEMMKTAPTVDAVPVVRCRDCCFSDWYTAVDGKQRCYCMEHGSSGHEEMDYCSYGEKDGDNEQDKKS